MTDISAEIVKKLRETTNAGMMECKKALAEAGGDMEKAARILRERGMALATKRAARSTKQGIIASAAGADGKAASLAQVNCETDFVARNDNFKAFVAAVAARACTTDASLADEMKADVTAKIAEIGENIVITRHTRFVLQGTGVIGSYIHMGGKAGVLVEIACGKAATASSPELRELATDLAIHVAAESPRFFAPDSVPADVIATEREIYAKQMEGKPANIISKIVDGKMQKFFTEVCLMQQPFFKDPKQSVTALLAAKGKALQDTLTIRRYVRYQLGE